MPTPKKILIADDEKEFTEAIEAFFKSAGHKIMVANSGLEAMRLLREFYFDLILLDLNMPDFDGIHVARVSKQTRPETKIIVITGYKEQYEADLKTIKVEQIMSKPIGINDLQKKVTAILGAAPEPARTAVVSGRPKVRLLFIEHDDTVYANLFKPYFDNVTKSKEAIYELTLAEDKDKAMALARILRPDIVLLNTNAIEFYHDIQKELQQIVAIPKEIIVHGKELYAKHPKELGIDPDQVTAIEAGGYSMDYPKRLEEAVREIAFRCGLVETNLPSKESF